MFSTHDFLEVQRTDCMEHSATGFLHLLVLGVQEHRAHCCCCSQGSPAAWKVPFPTTVSMTSTEGAAHALWLVSVRGFLPFYFYGSYTWYLFWKSLLIYTRYIWYINPHTFPFIYGTWLWNVFRVHLVHDFWALSLITVLHNRRDGVCCWIIACWSRHWFHPHCILHCSIKINSSLIWVILTLVTWIMAYSSHGSDDIRC